MKVILFGDNTESIKNLVINKGFQIAESDPDFVVCFGGDGTLMRAETAYPMIPKILLRDSAICKKCSIYTNEEVLDKVNTGSYKIEKLLKLEATTKGTTIHATNDVIVHNKNPRHGIRYTIKLNGKAYSKEIIGDGIIVSTPFGSSAYYRSITDSYFEVGIGLAFNNSTEQADHIVLKENTIIELCLLRGPGEVFCDNDPREVELVDGDTVVIKKSEEFAQIVCPE